MLEPTIFSYILNSYTQKLQRLKGGVLLKKLINDWKSKEENSIKQKAFLYGGHDSTIVNILRALNVWDPQLPGYGITILFEFSRDVVTGHYGLQVSLIILKHLFYGTSTFYFFYAAGVLKKFNRGATLSAYNTRL